MTPGSGGVGLIHAHHTLGHQTHCSRNAVAVELEVLKAGIAGPGEIHALALDHVEVRLNALREALQRVHHHRIQIVLHLTLEQRAGFLFPAIQPFSQLFDWPSLGLRAVHQFVGATTPDVDRPDGTPLLRRKKQRADIEGLGPLGGLPTAGLEGCVEIRGDEGHDLGRYRLTGRG